MSLFQTPRLLVWQALVLYTYLAKFLQQALKTLVCFFSSSIHVNASNMIVTEVPDSQPESEGVNLNGCLLIVPWSFILILLSKCQRQGCADQVLPSNMELSRNGNLYVLQ